LDAYVSAIIVIVAAAADLAIPIRHFLRIK
jgi:hypothetical protein